MKTTIIPLLVAVGLFASGCGPQMENSATPKTAVGGASSTGILGNATIGGLLDLVIGKVKLSQASLVGTWAYIEPGCAFTSENLLAQAGGAVAAAQVKSQLNNVYSGLGINANNTTFTFGNDGRFSARVRGIPLSGTYTFNANNSSVNLKMALLNATGYVTRTSNGIALTFESQKLLTLLQSVAALSGNSTLQTVGELSKQYDGVRMGMELRK